jgi:uncharacterized protein YgbK (DUF1537 family)
MKLGAIGDDSTGSSDLANKLAKQGMRVVQYIWRSNGRRGRGYGGRRHFAKVPIH